MLMGCDFSHSLHLFFLSKHFKNVIDHRVMQTENDVIGRGVWTAHITLKFTFLSPIKENRSLFFEYSNPLRRLGCRYRKNFNKSSAIKSIPTQWATMCARNRVISIKGAALLERGSLLEKWSQIDSPNWMTVKCARNRVIRESFNIFKWPQIQCSKGLRYRWNGLRYDRIEIRWWETAILKSFQKISLSFFFFVFETDRRQRNGHNRENIREIDHRESNTSDMSEFFHSLRFLFLISLLNDRLDWRVFSSPSIAHSLIW